MCLFFLLDSIHMLQTDKELVINFYIFGNSNNKPSPSAILHLKSLAGLMLSVCL